MKSVTKALGVLCLLFCAFIGNAQQEWIGGQVVTNDSTVIKGQILFEDWDISPTSIQFKDDGGNVLRKSAQDIKSFSVNEPSRNFESKDVVLVYYKKTVVPQGASPVLRTDSITVFLDVVLQSALVTLYEGMDDERNTRFFLQKDGRLHELRYPVYRLGKGEASHLIKSGVYKAQLKQFLSECPTLETDWVTYSDVDLVKLLEQYLRYCKTDFQTQFQQEELGQRLAFGALYRYANEPVVTKNIIGLNLLLFSKKKFKSAFVSIELGAGIGDQGLETGEAGKSRVYFGLYGGKYFGVGDWHPLIYTGISSVDGPLDTGVGISYQRIFHVSVSTGLIAVTQGEAAWSFQLRITPFSKEDKP